MIAVEVVDKESGEISYYEINKLGIQGDRVKMKLTNGAIRTISTKRFILTTVQGR